MSMQTSVTPYVFELFAFRVQFLHLRGKFGFGVGQLQFLGSNDLDYAVVDVESSHPLAEALAGVRRVLHERWIKVGIRYVPGNVQADRKTLCISSKTGRRSQKQIQIQYNTMIKLV